MGYIPKHFKAYELVSKDLYNKYKNREHILFWQFNTDLLKTADMLREAYGPMTINDWFWGGRFNERGLRLDGTGTGAGLSPHKRGAAIDCHFKNISAIDLRKEMDRIGCFKPGFLTKGTYTEEEKPFQYIRRVEQTQGGNQISWFHFDIFNNYSDNGSIIQLHV